MKAIPITEHKRNGTYRADRHKLFPLTPGEPPKPPPFLNKAAKKKWRETAELLAGAGILTALDLDALAAYCSAFATWRTAADTVERGQTYQSGELVKAHPAVAIMQAAAKEMQTWGDKLAMTPAARQRMRVELTPAKEGGISVRDRTKSELPPPPWADAEAHERYRRRQAAKEQADDTI